MVTDYTSMCKTWLTTCSSRETQALPSCPHLKNSWRSTKLQTARSTPMFRLRKTKRAKRGQLLSKSSTTLSPRMVSRGLVDLQTECRHERLKTSSRVKSPRSAEIVELKAQADPLDQLPSFNLIMTWNRVVLWLLKNTRLKPPLSSTNYTYKRSTKTFMMRKWRSLWSTLRRFKTSMEKAHRQNLVVNRNGSILDLARDRRQGYHTRKLI